MYKLRNRMDEHVGDLGKQVRVLIVCGPADSIPYATSSQLLGQLGGEPICSMVRSSIGTKAPPLLGPAHLPLDWQGGHFMQVRYWRPNNPAL